MTTRQTIITVASDAQLRTPIFYRRLWLAIRNVPIQRRDWLDELADTFRDFDGRYVYSNGKEYLLPDLDTTFGDDASMRWFGAYMGITDGSPTVRSYRVDRLRILDLYVQIKSPDVARHIRRR